LSKVQALGGNAVFVTPVQAGVQKNEALIDSRLRGNDINQGFLNVCARVWFVATINFHQMIKSVL